MIRTCSLSLMLMYAASAFAVPNSVTTCFTEVRLLGQLDDVEAIMHRLTPVFVIHGPVNSLEKDKKVSVLFLVSVTATDPSRAREQTDAEFVKRILSLVNRAQVLAGTRFLGCKTEALEP